MILTFNSKFLLRKTCFLVMELPIHTGVSLLKFQGFISQYPYRGPDPIPMAQNLGCFETAILKKVEQKEGNSLKYLASISLKCRSRAIKCRYTP